MALPDYIDNAPGRTLQETLIQLIEKEDQKVLDIATGFFRIEAWLRLEESMQQLESLRLLIGRDPSIRPAEADRIDLVRHFKWEVQQQVGVFCISPRKGIFQKKKAQYQSAA